jgi:hypothetical protein
MGDAQGDYSRLAEVVIRLGLHEHLCIYDTRKSSLRQRCLFEDQS